MSKQKKEKNKHLTSLKTRIKDFFKKPESRWKDIPSSIKDTEEYKNWKNLILSRENISFFRNFSIAVFIVSFLWCLIGKIMNKVSFALHITYAVISITTFVSSGLLIAYSHYLEHSKKSKAILEAFEDLREKYNGR